MRIAKDLSPSQRLRMHIDCIAKDSILVYPYFQDTLLALMEGDQNFPPEGRLEILRSIWEAIQELHAKDWVHTGSSCALIDGLPS
jgi:hypothetical protein